MCCVVERFICFLPRGLELIDLPLWLHARQHGARLFGQGQTLADLIQGIQVQSISLQRA